MFKPGEIPIPGYKLVGFIGQGAYGEVWKSQAPGGTQIALKFIPLQSAAGGVELKSANAVKLIRHANLIPINAIWLLDRNGNVLDDEALERLEKDIKSHQTMTIDQLEFKRNLAYLVIAMSLADGSLESRMEYYRDQGMDGIPLDELLEYFRQAAKGLDFLNEPRHLVNGERVGIVHRDVKPANLLLIGNSVVVGDFGVATSLREFDEKATEMVGSLGFMAPESIARQPTPSTDQYALAISYYYLRTGLMPYKDGQTFDSLIRLHKEGRLDFSHVDEREEAVLRKATSVTMEPRYANCTEFVAALIDATRVPSIAESPKKTLLVPALLGAIAIGLVGLASYLISEWNRPPIENIVDPVSVTTVQRTVTVTPPGTRFSVTIISEDGQTRLAGSFENRANNIELEESDRIQVQAENDSPLFLPLEKTFTQKELDDKGWNINLETRAVADVRIAAFQLSQSGDLDKALDLLVKASVEDSSVLNFPTPIRVAHPHDVLNVTAGSNNASFVLFAKDKDGQTLMRVAELKAEEASDGEWISLSLDSIEKVLQPVEAEQWPVVGKQSIQFVDAHGGVQKGWEEADSDFGFTWFENPAVYSPANNLLAAGDLNGNVHLWNIAMDSSLEQDHQTYSAHDDSVAGISFTGDGSSLISAGGDGSLRRWDVSSANDSPQMETIDAEELADDQIMGVWSTSGNRAVIATDKQLFVVEGASMVKLLDINEDGDVVQDVLVRTSPASTWTLIATDSLSNPLRLFNIETKETAVPQNSLDFRSVAAAAFSNDGRTIAVSTNAGNLALIDLSAQPPNFQALGTSNAKRMAFTRDDQFLIMILDDNTELIWSVDRCRLIMQARRESGGGNL